MAIDTTTPRTRRTLLAAGGAGLAAAAAATLARAVPASAEGENVQVGEEYTTATSRTRIRNEANNDDVLVGESGGDGTAVKGQSATGFGVHGIGGASGTGVVGQSPNGFGVQANSDSGVGLRVGRGRIRVDEVSGVATIQAGSTSRTVSPGVDINERTFVLLTPMANIGSRALWFSKNANANTFTIRMSPSRGRSTKVAWLALERA
jgi:hypothetical protein